MRGHLENKTGCCHDHHEAMLVVSEHAVFDNSAAHQDIRQVYFMQQIFEYTCGHIDVIHTYVPLCVEVPDPPCPPPVPCSPWNRWRRVVLQMPQILQLTPFDVEDLWLCSELLPVPHPISKTEPQARSTRTR